MAHGKRSGERDPILMRLANGVESVVSLLTAELGIVVLGLLIVLIVGASLIGLLLELLIGVLVLGAVATVGACVMFFFSEGL